MMSELNSKEIFRIFKDVCFREEKDLWVESRYKKTKVAWIGCEVMDEVKIDITLETNIVIQHDCFRAYYCDWFFDESSYLYTTQILNWEIKDQSFYLNLEDHDSLRFYVGHYSK